MLEGGLAARQSGESNRMAAEQPSAFPAVAQDIIAAAFAVGAHFDVAGVDPDRHAVAALQVLVANLEGFLHVARLETAVAADFDRLCTGQSDLERFERMCLLDRH